MGSPGRRGLVMAVGAVCGLALALAPTSCGSDVFACGSNDDCADSGNAGTCEASGYCSFPDTACPSGSRYGDHAGDSLAGDCVPTGDDTATSNVEDGSGTVNAADTIVLDTGLATDGDTQAEAETSPTTVDAATTDDPPGTCGDGTMDPGEACDDDNLIDGDGCNADCTPSGEIVWELIEDGGASLGDGAASIAIAGNDDMFVGAWVTTQLAPELAARKLALDGTIEWSTPIVGLIPWDSMFAWGIAVDDGGNPAIAGDGSTGGGNEWVVAQLDADGEIVWQVIESGQAFGIAIGQGVWACGRAPNGDGRVIGYDDDGAELDRLEGLPLHPAGGFAWDIWVTDGELLLAGTVDATEDYGFLRRAMPSGAVLGEIVLDPAYNQALALALGASDRWFVGSAGGVQSGWIAKVPPTFDGIDGPTIVTEAGSPANLHGVTVGPAGEVVVVGWQTVGDAYDALVQKYTPDAVLAWSRTYDGGSDVADYGRDVVIASDGTIVFVGHVGPLSDQADFWAVALTP